MADTVQDTDLQRNWWGEIQDDRVCRTKDKGINKRRKKKGRKKEVKKEIKKERKKDRKKKRERKEGSGLQ